MIEISKGVFVTDSKKFLEVYEARLNAVSVLSEGVLVRYELYKIATNGK